MANQSDAPNALHCATAIIIVAICVLGPAGCTYLVHKAAFEKGLCEGSIQGQDGNYWVPAQKAER